MLAIITVALGFVSRVLGISLPMAALVAGLALGAGPAGFAGKLYGEWKGYKKGYAAADTQGQLNDEIRRRQEVERDLTVSRENAELLRAAQERDQTSAAAAQQALEEYRGEIEKLSGRPSDGSGSTSNDGCALSDDDVRRLQRNHFGLKPEDERR